MAGSSSKAESLTDFLQRNGAHLHPDIRIISGDSSSGLHWRANIDIQPESIIISVPHSLSLSYLNALVDENWPFFKNFANAFKFDYEVEAVSYFYLMVQYVNRETSFWKPYLDALPGPESEHTQALFFEDPQDVAWLEGTDVWHTNIERRSRYWEIYDTGVKLLREGGEKYGFDTEPYTWNLFTWAVAMFTSRSFSSRALQHHDSKYWAAYRHSKDRRSQVVLLEKRGPARLSDFPVLFPGLDIGNHNPEAKIDYIFDPGRFDIKTHDATKAGDEVFNNYGPKGNDELLLGYGFCIPNNPHNTVPLRLKAPAWELQMKLKDALPGYVKDSTWNAEAATFKLTKPGTCANPVDIFQHLPEGLLELLIYFLRYARGYTFKVIEQPREYLASADGSRYQPHVAYTIVQSLVSKLSILRGDNLPAEPQNARQQQAAIYRRDLAVSLTSIIGPFQAYLDSLVVLDPSSVMKGRCLVHLETFLEHLQQTDFLPPEFLAGIEANANTCDIETLRDAGWEQDVWVLLLAALHWWTDPRPWEPSYISLDDLMLDEKAYILQDASAHPTNDLMDIVYKAREACSEESIWSWDQWDAERIDEMGKMLEFDSVIVTCSREGDRQPEPRLCVYLHDTEEPRKLIGENQ